MRIAMLALLLLAAGCKDEVTCGGNPCGPCPVGEIPADECRGGGWICRCVGADMLGAPDLAAPQDLATPPDLATPDLARPADLASPADLVINPCIYDGPDPCTLIECNPGKTCRNVVLEDGGLRCFQVCL